MSKLIVRDLTDHARPKLATLPEARLHLYIKLVEDNYRWALEDTSEYAALAQDTMANQVVLAYAHWVLFYPQYRPLFTRRAEALLGVEVDLTLPAPRPPAR